MTDGHRHWTIQVGPRTMRFFQETTVHRCNDINKVDASRFPYTGRTSDTIEPDENGYWRLSLLGFLHGLTGLTLQRKP